MKIITINLPEKYLDAIQTLINAKTYPSRSEAIRMALRNFLLNEQAFYKTLGSMKPMFLVESKKAPRMETIKPNIGKTEVREKEEQLAPEPFRSNKKPKQFINLFHGELYWNLIISFLYEKEMLNTNELNNLLGVNNGTITNEIRRLNMIHPKIIIENKTPNNMPSVYTLNKSMFDRLKNKTVREYFRGDRDLKVLQEKPVPVQNKQIHNCSINEEV